MPMTSTNERIAELAEKCAPYLRKVVEEKRTLDTDDVRAALEAAGVKDGPQGEFNCGRIVQRYIEYHS